MSKCQWKKVIEMIGILTELGKRSGVPSSVNIPLISCDVAIGVWSTWKHNKMH